MPILTFIDTLGIQSFIFSSNRLKDVVGGSELVSQATSRQGWIKELGYQANVIVGAGGNLLLQFKDKDEAKTFAAKFSRKALDEAPGLEVALVHHEYNAGQLAQAIKEIQIKIENHKLERRPSVPLLGLGVTAACRESQRSAVTLDVEGVPIAGEVATRRQDNYQNQKRWLNFLPCNYKTFKPGKGAPVELTFPLELDDLGRSYGDLSLMGVVHIDGNGIGQKLKNWLKDQVDQEQNDETVCDEYKALSHKIDNIAEQCIQNTY